MEGFIRGSTVHVGSGFIHGGAAEMEVVTERRVWVHDDKEMRFVRRQVTLNIFVMEFGQDTCSFSSKVGKALILRKSDPWDNFS